MANPDKNSPVAEQVKDLLSSDTTPVGLKSTKVALAASDVAAGVLSWQNPEGSAIVVFRLVLDVTSAATGACTLNVGSDGAGTSSSDNLLDGVDVGTAVGLFDNMTNKGTNGKELQRLDAKGGSTDYITASMASGASAGLVGNAYIIYYEV